MRNKVNFKIYDIVMWLTNNYNIHIAAYTHISQSKSDQRIKIGHLIDRKMFFFKNHA